MFPGAPWKEASMKKPSVGSEDEANKKRKSERWGETYGQLLNLIWIWFLGYVQLKQTPDNILDIAYMSIRNSSLKYDHSVSFRATLPYSKQRRWAGPKGSWSAQNKRTQTFCSFMGASCTTFLFLVSFLVQSGTQSNYHPTVVGG